MSNEKYIKQHIKRLEKAKSNAYKRYMKIKSKGVGNPESYKWYEIYKSYQEQIEIAIMELHERKIDDEWP